MLLKGADLSSERMRSIHLALADSHVFFTCLFYFTEMWISSEILYHFFCFLSIFLNILILMIFEPLLTNSTFSMKW